MKTKLFLAALIVLVSTAAIANGPGPKVAVIGHKNSTTFKVIYEGEKSGHVRMTITNQDNEVVFAETTNNTVGFMRNINFTGMEPGEYSIEIADRTGKQTQKISYANESSLKAVNVSKIADEGKYLLAVSNNGSEEINVRIFDGANNLVHSQDMIINGNLRLVYNLKDVVGVPSFEVTDRTGTVRTLKY